MGPGMPAVRLQNASKCYAVYASPAHRLKELLLLGRRSFHRDFWALRDVSFEIERGSTFSILGENGAGRSEERRVGKECRL